MSAREKIEGLTNTWYAYGPIAGLMSLMQNGIGFFSILIAGGSTLFSFVLTYFFGKRLLAKSGLTRMFLLVVSAIAMCLGTLGTARLGWAFLHDWSMTLLVQAVFTGSSAYMNIRSFRVLTDSSVKAYFA